MRKTTAVRAFDITFLVLFSLLMVGIPLIFTPLTRSVFEVNKLLLLRYTICITYVVWLLKYLVFKSNGYDNPAGDSYSVFGLRWKKIGLEIPILAWIGVNLVSSFLSESLRISIFGSYDRWEGIITISNYVMLLLMIAKLVTKRFQINWILGALVIPTGLSAIYGVQQSLGKDFMQWSVDPTYRVFACINNPVHYCAYVGMIVPVCVGWILYLSAKEHITKKSYFIPQMLIFLVTTLIYHTQFLSFSRATWIGFVATMPLFYLLVSQNFRRTSQKDFLVDIGLTALTIAIFFLGYFFQLHTHGFLYSLPIFTAIAAYLMYCYKVSADDHQIDPLSPKLIGYTILALGVIGAGFLPAWGTQILVWPTVLLPMAIVSALIPVAIWCPPAIKPMLVRVIIILLFSKLQFISVSLFVAFQYFVMTAAFYVLNIRGNKALIRGKKIWLVAFLVAFAAILMASSIPIYKSNLTNEGVQGGLVALNNVKGRMNFYQNEATKMTARHSMWMSSIPWIKENILFGTGPDTIKFMYPKYRRSEYGILEGGHNFTPDRLHNEYLNTLATRGLFGFVIYYFGIILGWYLIVLKGFYNLERNPFRFVLAGLVAGATVYLGQVMFNFGVVATLVLFFVLMGLSWAIARHPDFGLAPLEETQDDESL